jgi:MOSC domain-containing protein YiiM
MAAMATISGVWTSPARKSGRSDGHARRRAIAGEGLEGCAHANPPKREVLFVSADHLESVGVEPGAIRENLTVDGADVQEWPIGQRVRVGHEDVFEITMVCDPCHRMDELRDGLRAELDGKRGMLARIVESGEVAVGDSVELLEVVEPEPVTPGA